MREGDPYRSECHDDYLYGKREHDILRNDGDGLPGMDDTLGDFGKVIGHDHHIGSLHSSIGAHTSHGGADIGTCKYWSIIYPIAYEQQSVLWTFLQHHPFDMGNLILWKQSTIIIIDTYGFRCCLHCRYRITA